MKVRTSITHPLEIGEVNVPTPAGRIGMTLFPGRRDSLSVVAPWERDMNLDLQKSREWNPAIVVSLAKSTSSRASACRTSTTSCAHFLTRRTSLGFSFRSATAACPTPVSRKNGSKRGSHSGRRYAPARRFSYTAVLVSVEPE